MTSLKSIEPKQIFSFLGARAGISNDRYFVGRRQQLSSLSMCYFGDGKRSSVWIYGPRRIGKTSLADVTAMRANDNNTRVIKVDAIDISENYFDNLLSRAVSGFNSHIDLKGNSGKEKFESLAKSSIERPVLLIFDEMDNVAINLKTNEQAFLRRLDSEYDQFCYCFISRQPPELIVEEVPEINSRLLGVCEPHKVAPLEPRDVKKLCKLVGADLKIDDFVDFHKYVWSTVGGFPIAVNSLVKALAIACHHEGKTCQDEIHELFAQKFNELKIDLGGLWNSLNSISRMVLLREASSKGNEEFLREDGFYFRKDGVVRPEFLLKVGKVSGDSLPFNAASTGFDNSINVIVSELMRLMADINTKLHLKKNKNGFHLGNETLTHWRLCRSTCSEIEFNDLLNFLYKVFFEGARENKGDQHGRKQYRLPEPFATTYKKSKVIGAVSDLRNFNFHDFTRNTDSQKPNKDYIDAGEIFKTYCGNEIPCNEESRKTIRNGLIRDLVSLLKTINEDINSIESTD